MVPKLTQNLGTIAATSSQVNSTLQHYTPIGIYTRSTSKAPIGLIQSPGIELIGKGVVLT
jgi:hypothetical protein